jgi:OOP family OmpA-OmpF porin
MKIKNRISAIALAICASASGIASAAENTFYIGGSLGQSRPNFDTTGTASGIGTNFNSSDGAYKVYGGYNFHKNFSVEGTYINLGSYTSNAGSTADMAGWGVSLVGYLPLNKDFSLIGRLGENHMRLRRKPLETGDNTWSPTFGVGLKFDFNPNLSARAEFERILKMGSNTTTINTDANVYTLGLGYTF